MRGASGHNQATFPAHKAAANLLADTWCGVMPALSDQAATAVVSALVALAVPQALIASLPTAAISLSLLAVAALAALVGLYSFPHAAPPRSLATEDIDRLERLAMRLSQSEEERSARIEADESRREQERLRTECEEWRSRATELSQLLTKLAGTEPPPTLEKGTSPHGSSVLPASPAEGMSRSSSANRLTESYKLDGQNRQYRVSYTSGGGAGVQPRARSMVMPRSQLESAAGAPSAAASAAASPKRATSPPPPTASPEGKSPSRPPYNAVLDGRAELLSGPPNSPLPAAPATAPPLPGSLGADAPAGTGNAAGSAEWAGAPLWAAEARCEAPTAEAEERRVARRGAGKLPSKGGVQLIKATADEVEIEVPMDKHVSEA